MKIVLCLLVLLFTGCATISDYNQGCRDGISASDDKYSEKDRNRLCDDLDQAHRAKEADKRQTRHP